MPPLAPVVDSLEGLPEPVRTYYEPKDGKFHLSLSGAPAGFVASTELTTANGKVIEFRDTNIALKKQVDELLPLKTKFDGIDPEVAKADRAKVVELEKKGMKGADDIDAKFKTMLADALKPVNDALALSKAETLSERKRADESTLHSVIGGAFQKAGGKAKALDYAITQAKTVFEVKDGKVVAQTSKFSTEHPGDPLGVEEWLKGMAKENDFAFEPSKGSGANGGAGGDVPTGLKPGQTVLKDPTPAQLGEHASDILKGKVKVMYSES